MQTLQGQQTEAIIDEVGGIDRAIGKLREMIRCNRKKDDKAVEK